MNTEEKLDLEVTFYEVLEKLPEAVRCTTIRNIKLYLNEIWRERRKKALRAS